MSVVLVVAPAGDLHLRRVAQQICSHGGSVESVDLATLGAGTTIRYDPRRTEDTRIEQVGGHVLRTCDVTSVWLRRSARPSLPSVVPRGEDRIFARSEWRDLVSAVLLSTDARFVNEPVAQSTAAIKPHQLSLAARVGFRVADTIVTNSPQAVREFVHRHPHVVHKTLTSPTPRLLLTERWRPEADQLLDGSLPLAPTIFQEEVRDAREVRVTVVGDDVFAVRFDTRSADHVDSRLFLDVPWDLPRLPDSTLAQIRGLMDLLGLVYATLDFKERDDQYTFLELNPQGQFLYLEIATGLPIVDAMARLLMSTSP